jgi:hypothetical protein
MASIFRRSVFFLFAGILVLSACNMPGGETPPPTNQPGLIYTAAHQTVAAEMTQAAQRVTPTPQATLGPTDAPVVNPVNTATQEATSTNTPPPPATQAGPTNTPPPPTATPIPCDRASFVVKGETYKDGTEVVAGTSFLKTWRLKNTGSCTWGTGYSVVFISGDALSAPASFQMTTRPVAPGEEVDISIAMKAPDKTGEYTGNWKLRNSSGAIFGLGNNNLPFWIKIKVVSPATPTPTPAPAGSVTLDFLDKAPGAEWQNASKVLTWGDPANPQDGVVNYLYNLTLSDGIFYEKVLATYPQVVENGVIRGVFSPYFVQSGDYFKAKVGINPGCTAGQVKFQLGYILTGTPTPTPMAEPVVFREWTKTCDGNLLELDVDLSSLAGKTLRWVLSVHADGSPDQDQAIWVKPRIQR